jgi:hypothetical protein
MGACYRINASPTTDGCPRCLRSLSRMRTTPERSAYEYSAYLCYPQRNIIAQLLCSDQRSQRISIFRAERAREPKKPRSWWASCASSTTLPNCLSAAGVPPQRFERPGLPCVRNAGLGESVLVQSHPRYAPEYGLGAGRSITTGRGCTVPSNHRGMPSVEDLDGRRPRAHLHQFVDQVVRHAVAPTGKRCR